MKFKTPEKESISVQTLNPEDTTPDNEAAGKAFHAAILSDKFQQGAADVATQVSELIKNSQPSFQDMIPQGELGLLTAVQLREQFVIQVVGLVAAEQLTYGFMREHLYGRGAMENLKARVQAMAQNTMIQVGNMLQPDEEAPTVQ